MNPQAPSVLVVRAGSTVTVRCRDGILDGRGVEHVVSILRQARDDGSDRVLIQLPRSLAGDVTMNSPSFIQLLHELCTQDKPLVLAVDHDVCAGTVPMVVLSDFVVMAEQVQFSGGVTLVEPSIDAVVLQRLRLAMGHPKAFELAMLPRTLSAQECLRLGVVNQLCRTGDAAAVAQSMVEEVARLNRTEAWMLNRSFVGVSEQPGQCEPLLRTH